MENAISRNCQNLYLAVIAGGRGTRLFPHSHDGKPKQFCQLDAEHTFIQATVERFLDLGVRPTNSVIVTTNSNQGKLANDQLDRYGILSQNIIEIPFEYGYAGAMIEAAKFISRFDQNATIINTPSDHYIVANEIFSTVITQAIKNSLRTPTLVGVKTSNLATTMECGNAIYDPRGNSLCKTVTGFEEKPDETTADRLMREDRSAVNTGINIWTLHDIMEASAMLYNGYRGLSTDRLMNLFPRLDVAIGRFTWHDCGTLQALYEISKKTPHHKNASLGGGEVYRFNCLRSLFITVEGIILVVAGARDIAVVTNIIESRPVVTIYPLNETQRIRLLAEDYRLHSDFLNPEFIAGTRNNYVNYTSISSEVSVGFVGVHDYSVTATKNRDDNTVIIVSNNGLKQAG